MTCRRNLINTQREFLYELWRSRNAGNPFMALTRDHRSRTGQSLVRMGFAERIDRVLYRPDGKPSYNGRPRPTYELTEPGRLKLLDISCPRCYSIYSDHVKSVNMHHCAQCSHLWVAMDLDGMKSDAA